MTDINKLKIKLQKIEARKQEIHNLISETKQKNTASQKILLGTSLLKLAETDADAHAVLVRVFDIAAKYRPTVFIDAVIPPAPKADTSITEPQSES
jgi:hypothetical protein